MKYGIIISIAFVLLIPTSVFADWCPGCEYVPNLRITDTENYTLGTVSVGEEFHISADLANGVNETREFLVILQIKDQQEKTISITTVQKTMSAGQSWSPVIPITLYTDEEYTAEVFVWESFERAIPIFSLVSTPIHVESSQECTGTARCIIGKVTSIIDGDTIKVNGNSMRFALASAPELTENGGIESKNFIESLCPVGSTVTVDEDDVQTDGSYGRIIGVIYCNGVNLNEKLTEFPYGYISESFCENSEFGASYWAVKNGCQIN